MTPQVLGGLTSVAQKIQQVNQAALTAQQMAANAQSAAATNATALASLAGGQQTLTMLSSFVTFTAGDLVFDNNWHSLIVNGVPSEAKFLYVGGYVKNQGSPDNARQTLLVRATVSGSEMLISLTNGVSGVYENDSAIGPCFVQCSNSGFQYQWTAAVTDTNLTVYGYLS